jgi:solute:Na+ symporter, SSS family
LSQLDTAIIVGYVLAQFCFGVWVGIGQTADDFLVLSRRAKGVMILFSVVSSWVGVGVIVGTAAAGFDTGISFALTGSLGALVAVSSVALFAPTIKAFGDRFGAHTIGDFYAVRYSSVARALAAAIIVLVYLLLTAVQFTGLSALLRVWTGLELDLLVALVALTTIAYTAFAGIKSDFYTDAVHFIVMAVVLGGVLVPTVFRHTGNLASFSQLPPSYFDPFAFGGAGYFFGGLIFGVGVVLVSMELWQRIYAAGTAATAKRALIGSAIAIVPFYAIAAIAGMAAKLAFPSLDDRDLALFTLMREWLPRGLLGLGVAAFIAVFISSANTMMMVVSATLTKDVYAGFINRRPNERDLLRAGRVSTAVAGVIGWILSYIVHDIITLSVAALFVLLILLPSIVGGFFWSRSTNTAAVLSIVAGFVVTVLAYPFMPAVAFIPAFLISSLAFIIGAYVTSHGRQEKSISGV